MTRSNIITEIKRTAVANAGIPLGKERFFNETGIKEHDWLGKYWARWSDAIREAGYEPNKMQAAYESSFLLGKYIQLIRELGRLPVKGEFLLKSRADSEFPSHKTFARFGSKAQLVAITLEYCKSRDGLEDVIAICKSVSERDRIGVEADVRDNQDYGFVYLLKSGRFYKIGRSNAAGRRERELAIQLPEKATNVHVIRTDDPAGIEAYWHNRFANKRTRKNAEWFDLDASDVKTFRRRKFM